MVLSRVIAKKKPGGKGRIMCSHRANAKGYNWIEGPIYKIVLQPPWHMPFTLCNLA